MPTVTVTAAEGERLKIRIQKRVEKATLVQAHGYDENGNHAITTAYGPKATTWPDQSIENLVSDTRSYYVDADNRIVVEAA